MEDLKREVREHLERKLIPFWRSLRDDEYGGYYGWLGHDLCLDKKAVKGCILNSRILWFFSSAYAALGDAELLDDAKHAYEFLINYCIDHEYGGVFWSLEHDGAVHDDLKHTYNHAFAIYALSAYYDVSGDDQALCTAWELYELIEGSCRDEDGYLEAFKRDFTPAENDALSENGVMAERTMNTLLHVFEAYTELLRVTGSKAVEMKMREILGIFADKIYDPVKRRQEVFFDKNYNSLIDLHSYGHDVETSWLIDRGCEVIGDKALTLRMDKITTVLARKIYERAYRGDSVLNECENGTDDTTRVWWVQAESVVGFINAYLKNTENTEYLSAARNIWEYIKRYIVDPREGSEWFWSVDEKGSPIQKPIVEPWKCPYHNGRMCLELLRRSW